MRAWTTRLGIVLILCAGLQSCAGSRTKIGDIIANPGRFNEKKVKVSGEVVQTFAVPFLGQSLVRLDDGSGKIWVKPESRVPFKGDKLKVEGQLKVGLTVGSQNFGFIILEGAHRNK